MLYFNGLQLDGDFALIRVLHSKTTTIEQAQVHKIEVEGKRKYHKCFEKDCPFCANKQWQLKRAYIHLLDYTNDPKGEEKIWTRTPAILKDLESLQNDGYDNLSEVVIKVTKIGDDNFAKTKIDVPNQNKFSHEFDKGLVDQPLAHFHYLNRKLDKVEEFLKTGKFPESTWVPKEEFEKNKAAQAEQADKVAEKQFSIQEDSLPF